jgi:MoxR-like ATPase
MSSTAKTYAYVFQGGPVNSSYSLIHCIEKEKKKRLLWGFPSKVKGYNNIKEGDMAFLYVTKTIKTVVASGYVESKFIDESKFWPIDYKYGETWPKRVWIRIEYIYINDEILNLLRKCSQCNTDECYECYQLNAHYKNLRDEIQRVYKTNRGSILPISRTDPNKIREILAKYCIKVSATLKDIFKDLIKVEESANIGLKHLEALILIHLIAGKNAIITGPPGSGKTTLSGSICKTLGVESRIVTGNPEWTPFDTIGGRDINGIFRPGLVTNSIIDCWRSLKNKDVPAFLIIDEINRANVDLALGRLFTLLDIKHRENNPLIETTENFGDAFKDVLINGNLYVPYSFRIIATMNNYDKALLFKLGYALLRRFAVVEMRRNFKFEPNPQGWIERVKEFIKEKKGCELEKSVNLDIIENELKNLSRPTFNDYALIDLSLQTYLEKYNGIRGILEKLATNLGLTYLDILGLIYKIICAINEKLYDYDAEVTEAPVADIIKFITISTLLDENWASQHLATLLDEAFSSYVAPQIDILADRVRAENLKLLPLKGERSLKKELKDLSEMMKNLGLIKFSDKLSKLAGGESIL